MFITGTTGAWPINAIAGDDLCVPIARSATCGSFSISGNLQHFVWEPETSRNQVSTHPSISTASTQAARILQHAILTQMRWKTMGAACSSTNVAFAVAGNSSWCVRLRWKRVSMPSVYVRSSVRRQQQWHLRRRRSVGVYGCGWFATLVIPRRTFDDESCEYCDCGKPGDYALWWRLSRLDLLNHTRYRFTELANPTDRLREMGATTEYPLSIDVPMGHTTQLPTLWLRLSFAPPLYCALRNHRRLVHHHWPVHGGELREHDWSCGFEILKFKVEGVHHSLLRFSQPMELPQSN